MTLTLEYLDGTTEIIEASDEHLRFNSIEDYSFSYLHSSFVDNANTHAVEVDEYMSYSGNAIINYVVNDEVVCSVEIPISKNANAMA